ncbi:hypothetical protein ACFPN2_14270 [Steroidobacter flavus]|uniref:DUF1269 domain-containing protein n=1 Tax=Steroidobacter flavus TaxID=1842136 RepID=A0ABV8SUP5_9GAMM
MKCIYYLTSTLKSTQDVSDDLHEVGVEDFYLHVISKDECGLKKQHIHSSNYLETLDIVRDGFIGAAIGCVAGLIGISLLMYFKPLGADFEIPTLVYALLVGAATLFGAWEGGLTGIATENKKLARFHDDIAAGKYLILVYVGKNQEATVRKMMDERHSDADMVAIDSHCVNPFTGVDRVAQRAATRT